MLLDLPVKAFLDETASDSPAPGGGSVSALAGALGAALAVMTANLTRNAEGDAAAAVERLRGEGGKLLAELAGRVDEDTAAFNAVMAAFKLPRSTDREKAARSAAIQAAMKEAASVPAGAAEACVRVMALSLEALRHGNPNAASDAAVSGRLAYAGLWGAVYNARINIASIKDDDFNKTVRAKIAAALAEGGRLLAELSSLGDDKIRP
jgi:formiminotetrahydrofolate cyclodeaminase